MSESKDFEGANEGEVYFALFGDEFDPEEVTRIIGVAPTSVRRKAAPRPKHSWWIVSTGRKVDDVLDVYEMSSTLVARLAPHVKDIVKAKDQLGLEAVLNVVLRITTDDSKSTPALGFDQNVISFLSAVGATIDIDTYLNDA